MLCKYIYLTELFISSEMILCLDFLFDFTPEKWRAAFPVYTRFWYEQVDNGSDITKTMIWASFRKAIATYISTSWKFVWLKRLLCKYICLSSYPGKDTLQISAPCVINLLYLDLLFHCMQFFKSVKMEDQWFDVSVPDMSQGYIPSPLGDNPGLQFGLPGQECSDKCSNPVLSLIISGSQVFLLPCTISFPFHIREPELMKI